MERDTAYSRLSKKGLLDVCFKYFLIFRLSTNSAPSALYSRSLRLLMRVNIELLVLIRMKPQE